jgi:hypothetical protein
MNRKLRLDSDNDEFINEDLFEDNGDDMEIYEEEIDIEDDAGIDNSYISSLANKINRNELLSTFLTQSKDNNDKSENNKNHPIDSYLKGLILEVLKEDFMPLLERRLSSLEKNIIKKH